MKSRISSVFDSDFLGKGFLVILDCMQHSHTVENWHGFMLIPDALFCLSSSLIACWFLWPILLCQTCMHSALYFTLCPFVTFSNFCETFSSNSPLCYVASAIVSPFFMILHNFTLKWTSRAFSTSFFTEIRFPHS